jgi:ribosomal 50S subunit-recycling heat shock protein
VERLRADVLLKSLCLVKSRNLGRRGCEEGYVRIGGRDVKPSREVRAGDIVEIRYPGRVLVIEILEVPRKQIARKDQDRFFRVVREEQARTVRSIWDE